MRLADLVRLLPLGALVAAGCPGPASSPADPERHRAPPLDEGSADAGAGAVEGEGEGAAASASASASGAPAQVSCGAASCSGGSCGGH